MTELSNEQRMKRIKGLAGVKEYQDLAPLFGTNQPQISRWKSSGFAGSVNFVIDFLLSVISKQKREINKLKKQLK